MLSLQTLAYIIGAVVVMAGIPFVVSPSSSRRFVRAFPRSRLAAVILTAVDMAWIAWIVDNAALGRFEWVKPGVYPAAIIVFVAIVVFMDDLLAPRALGGLVLLAANPIMREARVHPSPLSLIMTVFAYMWVVAGIVLVLSPYRLRQMAERLLKTDSATRVVGFVRIAVGSALILLGALAY